MKTRPPQTTAAKGKPPTTKTKTVSFEIPIEEYETMEQAIRTFYAGVFYGDRPYDIGIHAGRVLRIDVGELLEKVPATRVNSNSDRAAESGAEIIPFLPHRAKRHLFIPSIA